jgi:hypothetical protein
MHYVINSFWRVFASVPIETGAYSNRSAPTAPTAPIAAQLAASHHVHLGVRASETCL